MDYKKKAESLLFQLENQHGLNRRMVEKRLNYSTNYIDQILSKGSNAKFIAKLEYLLSNPNTIDYDIGIAIRKIEASNEVILSAVGEVLAKINNQSSTVVREQLEQLVKKKINEQEF